ncbi:hypothetical protein IW148_001060 [Coemansia sp. RSA 1199]|nr:hypothetical protein IW148_001060 [Coemansia sp. RSA 1199]
MDSYQSQFAYAPSADAYMNSLRYPSMGMTPMMGPMHMAGPMDTFASGPAPQPAVAAMGGMPAVSQLPCSSRIGSKASPCSIYRHDEMQGATSEHRAQQLCATDGRLYIEHIPNHSVVFIPLASSIDQVLGSLRKPRAQSKHSNHTQPAHMAPPAVAQQPTPTAAPQPRKPKEKSAKPINAFIKYRSYKIAELKRLHPEVSQTDISRLAGEYWKAESEEVKNQFRCQYREEKKVYDMKKAINATATSKRPRESSETPSDVASAPLDDMTQPAGFNPSRRRSLTLPPTATPNQRATSASPLLSQSNPKRRRCVTAELRKQLAAKSSSLLATPPMRAAVASLAAGSASEIARAQSMGLDDSFHSTQAEYNSMCYYGALSLASSISHASPQLLGLSAAHTNSPYLDELAMAPLPIAPTFSMPCVAPMSEPALSVNTSFVAPEDPVANSAFELYTTASDHDELASSLVSASLVAASLSSLMASSQPAASASDPFSAPMVATAAPIAEFSVSNGSFQS